MPLYTSSVIASFSGSAWLCVRSPVTGVNEAVCTSSMPMPPDLKCCVMAQASNDQSGAIVQPRAMRPPRVVALLSSFVPFSGLSM